MNPVNGNLSEWQVRVMIGEAIKEYDGLNTKRHDEHTKKLDRLMYLILGTLLTAAAGLVVDVVIHATGR
jgi:hypothetical protein